MNRRGGVEVFIEEFFVISRVKKSIEATDGYYKVDYPIKYICLETAYLKITLAQSLYNYMSGTSCNSDVN